MTSIPSPPESVWHLGPLPLRAYTAAIGIGIMVAVWIGNRRWIGRGGDHGAVLDIAVWAVPFGIVGARAYHVLTDWDTYFGAGRDPVDALRIWEGGLSIWGAISAEVLGGYVAARRAGIPFPALADAVAPVSSSRRPSAGGATISTRSCSAGRPTCRGACRSIRIGVRQAMRASRRSIRLSCTSRCGRSASRCCWSGPSAGTRMGHGGVFALYVALYTTGRTWIELLRIDTGGAVEGPARELRGLRTNAWLSILPLLGAVVYLVMSARLRPGRETITSRAGSTSGDARAGERASAR
jgi:prolipoprotein diacylglyceryltransferase